MSGLGFTLGLVLCVLAGCINDYRRGLYRDLDSMRRARAQRDALRRIK